MPRAFRAERQLRPMFRAWQRHGCSPAVAGNLVAVELGMPTTTSGWTLEQLAHLRFLAELVRTGRLSP